MDPAGSARMAKSKKATRATRLQYRRMPISARRQVIDGYATEAIGELARLAQQSVCRQTAI